MVFNQRSDLEARHQDSQPRDGNDQIPRRARECPPSAPSRQVAEKPCLQVLERYESLQETAQALSELDVALGFAELAVEMNLVRPVVDERFVFRRSLVRPV
jgi:hypothetical protein